MALRARKVASVVTIAVLPGLLAACGSAPASATHVVHSPTTPGYPAPGAASGTDPLESAAAQQSVTDVQNGLGAVDSGLAQVDTDLNNPQADS